MRDASLHHAKATPTPSRPQAAPLLRCRGLLLSWASRAGAGLAYFGVMMKWRTAVCWTFILLAALFFEDGSSKGGRGGARGAARGGARGTTRRSKSSYRYRSPGAAVRVAAAAAAGAAAGAAAAVAADRMRSGGGSNPESADNSTVESSYNYRAWTSGAESWHLVPLSIYLLCAAGSFSL